MVVVVVEILFIGALFVVDTDFHKRKIMNNLKQYEFWQQVVYCLPNLKMDLASCEFNPS